MQKPGAGFADGDLLVKEWCIADKTFVFSPLSSKGDAVLCAQCMDVSDKVMIDPSAKPWCVEWFSIYPDDHDFKSLGDEAFEVLFLVAEPEGEKHQSDS
jgi:hypothetical protein